MATLLSDAAATSKQAKTGLETITAIGTYTIVANPATGDLIRGPKIPLGAVVSDVIVSSSASLGATSTAEVGDTGDTDRFITSGNFANGAAGFIRMNAATGNGYAYTAETPIDVKLNSIATPATGAVVKIQVQYYIP